MSATIIIPLKLIRVGCERGTFRGTIILGTQDLGVKTTVISYPQFSMLALGVVCILGVST